MKYEEDHFLGMEAFSSNLRHFPPFSRFEIILF
jgi:hypothetical protein